MVALAWSVRVDDEAPYIALLELIGMAAMLSLPLVTVAALPGSHSA